MLIAYEPETFNYFGSDIRADIEEQARALGLHVTALDVGFEPSRDMLPDEILARLQVFDIVLFLSRLGEQLRFADLPDGPRFIVCFAPNSHLLGSAFGVSDYNAFLKIKTAVD